MFILQMTQGGNTNDWDFQTLTDVAVLDTAWYDQTASIGCA